ncbi:MAG TPA: hypothetical protein PKE29_06250 [Phycisphaerales bacterium]|nr:hypothetical protein [Phycisphaerales bacterium]
MSRSNACVLAAGMIVAAAGAARGQDVTRPGNPITGTSTNTPAAEVVANVIDNRAGTKYLNFDILNTGFTVTPTGTDVVRCLTFITANDSPQRDPASYTLEGSNDGANFSLIADGTLNLPSTRFALGQVLITNSQAFTRYRMIFPTVRGPASANSMQIAEVQLNAQGNILTPGDAITAVIPATATIPAGQGVTSLIDGGLATRFSVVGGNLGPTRVDITPAAGGTIVTGIDVLGSSDDATFPNRVPPTLTLSGSNDGTSYTPIFTTPLTQFTANYADQQYAFANAASYTRYRLELGATAAASMQLGEVQLFGTTLGAAPANDLCAGATVVADGTTNGSTINATGTDGSSCGNADSADVWFRYTATTTGTIEANTCGAGAMDTVLSVHASCGGAEIGCNDNACLGKSRVLFAAVGGTQYLVRVAGVDGATGSFTLNIIPDPVVHTDVPVQLAWNFNGMAHNGEENNPDSPDGYRSLSDRGMRITGTPGSLDVGPEGATGIPYSVGTQAGVLDTVQLGNRNTADNGGHVFDLIADGDNVGVAPDWLIFPTDHVDQSGPQTSTIGPSLFMGASTKIGLIGNASNGGATFSVTLGFADSSTAMVRAAFPDWFGMQVVGAPQPGVESQTALGLFSGAGSVDNGVLDADLNVVEVVVSPQSLMSAGLGDVMGKQLTSITFSDSTSGSAGIGIYAMTVRDPGTAGGTGVCCRGATCSTTITTAGACSASVSAALAGASFQSAAGACNAGGGTTAPCCYADYNKVNGIEVQDIFDFLNDWLAGRLFARVGGDGDAGPLEVQNIFDFLNAWLGGGC